MNKLIRRAEEVALSYQGTPYIWGGDDPLGFDCSGLCIEVLKSVGFLPRSGDWTAALLYDKFAVTEQGHLGCLVFYHSSRNPQRIIHVEFCLGDGLAIGASGGGSSTTSIATAMAQNAFIKIRPIDSRKNLLGFTDPFIDLR